MFVDTHVHVLSADHARYPLLAIAPRGTWADRPFPLKSLDAEMTAAGIDAAIVVQALTPYGFDNGYLIDAIDHADARRFVAVVALDPMDPATAGAIAQLGRNGRVRGVRFPASAAGRSYSSEWLHDTRADALWRAAADAGMSIVLWTRPEDLLAIAAVARRFPGVTVAVDHVGGARFASPDMRALEPIADLSHVLVKFTTMLFDEAAVGVDASALVEALVRRFGAERVMWGSNYPASGGRSYREMRELAERSVARLSATDRERVLGGVATRLYRL